MNKDGESEGTAEVKPPPKAFEMGGAVRSGLGANGGSSHFQPQGNSGGPQVQQSGPASLPPVSTNKYKLQKGKRE